MAFPHPFSGSSKPLPSSEYWDKTGPLPFAATLNRGPLFSHRQNPNAITQGDQLEVEKGGPSRLARGLARLELESTSGNSAARADGSATLSPTLTNGSLPGDENAIPLANDVQSLAERKIAECVYLDDPRLDLSDLGLRYLPDDVANLRYIFRIERKTSFSGGSGASPQLRPSTARDKADAYKTPPGSPKPAGRNSPSIQQPGPAISASIRSQHVQGQRHWTRSASLPSSMLPAPSFGSPSRSMTSGLSSQGLSYNSPRGTYSNPLGLGPPPSMRSGLYDGFLPPGSPVMELGEDEEEDDDQEHTTRRLRRDGRTLDDLQPSPLKGKMKVGILPDSRRIVTAPSLSSRARVRFDAELGESFATASGSGSSGIVRRSSRERSPTPSSSSSSRSSSTSSSERKLRIQKKTPPGNVILPAVARSQPRPIDPSKALPSASVDMSSRKTFIPTKSLSSVSFLQNSTSTLGSRRSLIQRTPSGFYVRAEEVSWTGEGGSDLAFYLSRNAIRCLPSSLFLVTNLTVLSLRGNQLERLPAGIGQLKRLKELNVSNNRLVTFPPSLLDLTELTVFNCINNPLLRVLVETATSGRNLGPLMLAENAQEAAVPSLYSMCMTKLLSTSEPTHIPPLLSRFDWNPEGGEIHALQSAANLQSHLKHLKLKDCARIIQALRSASDAKQARAYDQGLPDVTAASTRKRLQKTRRERETALEEDAADNPFFAPCPNPQHYRYDGRSDAPKVSKWIYLHRPVEHRIQYVDLAGEKAVPIKWEGCAWGCLDFLAEAAPESDGAHEDGFDIAVLEEEEQPPWTTQL